MSSSKTWTMKDGAIRHIRGGFFNVVGARWIDLNHESFQQPLIDQREIGTLGFILCNVGKKPELLVQAKVEPGNVGIAQLAPTCQATASNAARIHGGEAPPYIDPFEAEDTNIIFNTLQSEQGTRFFHKLNRNIVIQYDRVPCLNLNYRWIAVDDILPLLGVDFLINTDSRSVLTCCPWDILIKREPFNRYTSTFGRELAYSYRQKTSLQDVEPVKSALETLRGKIQTSELINLDDLENWQLTDTGVEPVDETCAFRVRHIRVHAYGREVSSWDQPIVDSLQEGYIDLICGRLDNTLHFLFYPQIEIGLFHKIELGPIIYGSRAHRSMSKMYKSESVVRMTCRQSEEGGRFYQDINNYRIVDQHVVNKPPPGGHWLTLGQVRTLLSEEGWFTNEARSALSLLLTWL